MRFRFLVILFVVRFPTLFFIKAGEKIPERFEGSRTVEGLLDYVKLHGSRPSVTSDTKDEL